MEVYKIYTDADGAPSILWGGHTMQLENFPLTDKAYIEKANKELRETPEIVADALAELKKLLLADDDLMVPIDNDDFLMKFLRPCKFYAASAYKRMQEYYKFRASHKDNCHELRPGAVQVPFEESVVSMLSPRDQHGRRILLVDSERWNPRHVPVRDLFRCVQVALEAAIMEPATQVNGVVVILDMKSLSFAQVMQFTPSFAKMIIDWIQDCVPLRLKAVYIINQPYIFNMLFAIFKPFMREKLRSRIQFLGSNKASLLALLDAGCLRQRHGGKLPDPDIPGELVLKCLMYYDNLFKESNSYGYKKNKS